MQQPVKKSILSFTLAFCFFTCAAQEQLGLRLGNYSGINGTMFNPAFNVHSPFAWDVNFISAGAFAENNYIYLKEASLLKIIRNRSGYVFAGALEADVNRDERLVYDFTRGMRKKEGYVNLFLTGPSAMFHIRQHTFGVFLNFRSVASINRLSHTAGYYNILDMTTGEMMRVERFKSAAMAWSEIGLNYGKNIRQWGKHTLDGGATLKFLQGYEAVYFQNHQPVNITMQIDSMNYADARVTFGVATGVSFGGEPEPYHFRPRGHGASMDAGIVYYMNSGSKSRDYDWKIGISLLDFGKIIFSRDAQAHEISTDRAFDFIQGQYPSAQGMDEIFRLLSLQSLSDSGASRVSNRFGMWTPAGISFFAERPVLKNIFINAAAVRRLRFRGAVPERDNIWALTARYEHRWFEAMLPVVLYNDKDVRVGISLRMGPLTIGSDNFTSWVGSGNFSGSDVYVALKLNPSMLKQEKQIKYGKGRVKTVDDCFDF